MTALGLAASLLGAVAWPQQESNEAEERVQSFAALALECNASYFTALGENAPQEVVRETVATKASYTTEKIRKHLDSVCFGKSEGLRHVLREFVPVADELTVSEERFRLLESAVGGFRVQAMFDGELVFESATVWRDDLGAKINYSTGADVAAVVRAWTPEGVAIPGLFSRPSRSVVRWLECLAAHAALAPEHRLPSTLEDGTLTLEVSAGEGLLSPYRAIPGTMREFGGKVEIELRRSSAKEDSGFDLLIRRYLCGVLYLSEEFRGIGASGMPLQSEGWSRYAGGELPISNRMRHFRFLLSADDKRLLAVPDISGLLVSDTRVPRRVIEYQFDRDFPSFQGLLELAGLDAD